MLQGNCCCLHLFVSYYALRRGKLLGDVTSREDQEGSRMLVQGARHGLLVPGYQISGTRLAWRDNQRDGARGQPQDTARDTSDHHAPYPLGKRTSSTPTHHTVITH